MNMKKKISLIFCLITSLSLFGATPTKQQKQALFMMNYAQYVTYKLKTYNNIIALEEEYVNLNDNMNFSTIEDYDSITTINLLADSIYNERKNHKNRERLKIALEKQMNQSLYNSMPNINTIITGSIDPISLAINATRSVGNIFVNYQQYKNKLSEEYDEKMYQYQVLTEDILNNLYQDLNTYTYNLVQKYNLSDEWRLNKKELEDIFKYLKDSNPERKYTNLKNMSEDRYIQHFPMFWYHLARAAEETGDTKSALGYYERFENENIEIFRYDRTAVDAYKGKIVILLQNQNENKQEILEKLRFIENNKTSWNDYYFCALVYSKLNDNINAKRLLERNINELSAEVDNQFLDVKNLEEIFETSAFSGKTYYDALELCRKLLSDVGGKNVSQKSIELQYKNDTQAFNEVLYNFGLQTSSSLVHNSMKDIKKISVAVKTLSEKSCQIDAKIPIQWVMSSDTELIALFYKDYDERISYVMNINEKESKKQKKNSEKITDCNFIYSTGKININWKKEGYYFGGLLLKHSLYPVHFVYFVDINKPARDLSPEMVYFNEREYEIK